MEVYVDIIINFYIINNGINYDVDVDLHMHLSYHGSMKSASVRRTLKVSIKTSFELLRISKLTGSAQIKNTEPTSIS